MPKPEQNVSVPIQVSLKQATYDRLAAESRSGDVIRTLTTWASWFLEQYAGGGIMLQQTHLEHLRKLAGDTPITEAASIVKLVEVALGREQGQYTFKFQVDPALIPSLEQHAKETGWTVEEIIQETISQVTVNGWLYEFPAEDSNLPIGRQDHDFLAALTGKHSFTARELCQAIRSKMVRAAPAAAA